MTIYLKNNSLQAKSVCESVRSICGVNMNAIQFEFDSDEDLTNLDAIFSAENCESIRVVDSDTEQVFSGYTTKAEVSKVRYEAEPTEDGPVFEYRVIVALVKDDGTATRIAELERKLNAMTFTINQLSTTVQEVEKKADSEMTAGDYLNPIPYKPGMAVINASFYTDGENIWEAIATGVPTGFDDTHYFDIIS